MACVWCAVVLALFCIEATRAQSQGDLRLVGLANITGGFAGRAEVFISGEWGTICDDGNIGYHEAKIVCRQLGYAYASRYGATLGYPIGPPSQPIWISALDCPVIGTNLLRACSYAPFYDNDCDHSQDLMVQCSGTYRGYGDLRLAQGNVTSFTFTAGRLEIYFPDEWGTICDNFFGHLEADVACRQLGYSEARQYGNNLGFGSGSSHQPIWLDRVNCSEFNSRILNCRYDRTTGDGNYCGHNEDIMINCGTSFVPTIDPIVANSDIVHGALRLVQGSVTSSSFSAGRLEIFLYGEWGTICASGFGLIETLIACKQLGYNGVLDYGTSLGFGSGSSSQEIWLADLDCNVFTTSIIECSHSGVGTHSCQHSADVMINCSFTPPTPTSQSFDTGTAADIVGIIVGSVVGVTVLIIIFVVACITIIVCVCYCSGPSSFTTRYRRFGNTAVPPIQQNPQAGFSLQQVPPPYDAALKHPVVQQQQQPYYPQEQAYPPDQQQYPPPPPNQAPYPTDQLQQQQAPPYLSDQQAPHPTGLQYPAAAEVGTGNTKQ